MNYQKCKNQTNQKCLKWTEPHCMIFFTHLLCRKKSAEPKFFSPEILWSVWLCARLLVSDVWDPRLVVFYKLSVRQFLKDTKLVTFNGWCRLETLPHHPRYRWVIHQNCQSTVESQLWMSAGLGRYLHSDVWLIKSLWSFSLSLRAYVSVYMTLAIKG